MQDTRIAPAPAHPARMKLEPYSADIRLNSLTLGVDNIHYDVFLSPRFVEFSRRYLLDLIRQTVNVTLIYGKNLKKNTPPEHAGFRKILTDVLEASTSKAKEAGSIEVDVLHRLAILKFLQLELANQFTTTLVECKDWIRSRGHNFEHSEQAHVMRSKISEIQADRKNIFRKVGDTLGHIWRETEDNVLWKSRRALFGDDFRDTYELLQNRFLFVEGGSDEYLFLEHYVLLGNFMNDPDRFGVFDGVLLDFVRDVVLQEENFEDLSQARKTLDRLMDQARNLRAEMVRLEQDQDEIASRGGDGIERITTLFRFRGSAPDLQSGQFDDIRRKSESLEKSLEDLGPQIEAARQRLAFLTDEHKGRIGDYLNQPANARRLFDASMPAAEGDATPEMRARLLEEWMHRLEERDLLFHALASYEVRKIHSEYCPPIHLQQLKKALVNREEGKRVEQILEQYPARKVSMKKLEDASRAIRRRSHEETLQTALQFAEDFMRLRRDRRNYQHVVNAMERISLVRSEHSRELSRANKSLYEFLHPEEGRPTHDLVINHAVIKADVRGSTELTKDLLERGLNPASHFSMNLHEPVKRMLEHFGAAKVFIEGDAIILAIYEHESTRTTRKAVARACVLAREILAVTSHYNSRVKSSGLPALELGIGLAFQDSAPALWMDGDSKIMISKALNLSDRLSSCSKMAKRLFGENQSPFNVFQAQALMDEAAGDEAEIPLVRYNLNGIELNDEGFQKLSTEIALSSMAGIFPMPWGKDRVQLYFGELSVGGSLEPIIIRKGFIRQLLAGAKVGEAGNKAYYEVCTDLRLLELARSKFPKPPSKN
jgi:class 3 adenylate cyclase